MHHIDLDSRHLERSDCFRRRWMLENYAKEALKRRMQLRMDTASTVIEDMSEL
jgi:hypothetical protein